MSWLVGLFLKRLMKGRTVQQLDTAFWAVVIVLVGLFLTAWLLQSAAAPASAPH